VHCPNNCSSVEHYYGFGQGDRAGQGTDHGVRIAQGAARQSQVSLL